MKAASLFLSVVVVACLEPDKPMAGATTRDSAGVRIIQNPAEDPDVTWRVTTQPLVDIGGADGQDLYRVVSALRLSDGRIAVGNRGTSELRYYDATGALSNSAGGDGDGPGEFRQMMWLGLGAADSVTAFDLRDFRYSVFDARGTFVRLYRLQTTDAIPFAYVVGAYADGSFLTGGFSDTGGRTPDGLQRYDSPLHHFDANGQFVADLGMFPGTEMHYVSAGSGGFTLVDPLFPLRTHRVAAGRFLIVAANDSYELRRYTPDGALTALIRRDYKPTSVSAEHIRLEREQRLAAVSGFEREQLARALQSTPTREAFPAYHLVRADDDGMIWVQDYPVPPHTSARWTVFDSTGVMHATAVLPVALEPTHIGRDFIVGTVQTELGVEHVRVYGLQRRPL